MNPLPLGDQSGALVHSATQILAFQEWKLEFIKIFNNKLLFISKEGSLLSCCTVLFFPIFTFTFNLIGWENLSMDQNPSFSTAAAAETRFTAQKRDYHSVSYCVTLLNRDFSIWVPLSNFLGWGYASVSADLVLNNLLFLALILSKYLEKVMTQISLSAKF